ncbi:hypothetical protein [Siccibacter turicensis]|uniref:hypothetical protein n=1 Tax=Siccibacter turicensis TaxID=357233 RepID=UPI0023F3C144|nr:hypothetical protein [Siccibacter turicensis]
MMGMDVCQMPQADTESISPCHSTASRAALKPHPYHPVAELFQRKNHTGAVNAVPEKKEDIMQVNRSGALTHHALTEAGQPSSSEAAFLKGPLNGFHPGASAVQGSEAPENLKKGLLGMGQVALLEGDNTKMETGGCGPCIGVGITYRSNTGEVSGLLAHLQPEADIDDFAANVRHAFDDHFESEIKLTLATTLDQDKGVASDQQLRLDKLQNSLKSQYDFLDLDDENIHVSTSHSSLSVDVAKQEIRLGQDTENDFSKDDMDYMQRHMLNGSSSLRYFS